MTMYNGVGVYAGRVIGPVLQMPEPIAEPAANLKLAADETPEQAAERIKAAADAVKADLLERAENASRDGKAVLKSTSQMATDRALLKGAIKLVENQGVAPERAIWESATSFADQMAALGGYMAERVTDIYDVRARIVAQLTGQQAPGIPTSDEPFILAAIDLAPADTATLNPEQVIALITSDGGPQAHTAILARGLGLPAIVAAKGVTEIANGTVVYVDSNEGTVNTEPSEEHRVAAEKYANRKPLADFDGTGVMADGTRIPLYANVGDGKSAEKAAGLKAEGVGLLRTEFGFLGYDAEPSVDTQAETYKSVFDAFPGKHIVVRTLDAGADKPLPFLNTKEEENPALGVRGFRTDWTVPGVLARQLEAIKKASEGSDTDIWVMAPMISTTSEARNFANMLKEVGLETRGVMVETPAAAVNAEAILGEVDFVSIGTNDLTQYTMAADRLLGDLAHLNNPWQPAVLKMIKLTVEGARRASTTAGTKKYVSVCGEAAADPALAVVLVGLGVDTLSMNAGAIAAVSAVLKSVTKEKAQQIAVEALAQISSAEAKAAARKMLPVLDELGL
ncbi:MULTISPECIES: phosphoenolpyruvate--protein phosphotransferase [unclassified Rothia (in: high G+C Gram-positive bacteria)]|uniref:phosphoenolpyruvate--protein phosphotransferase n=1 Tax=unclassified Rothia (in: high G+C Gram-positive bacteria) TaxID=2689056 RepID=UPI00195D0562|nr:MULTISPECIES: phosphoenolpyruvate--protein phosphotransferase [unclassified Rothia (in: high G+C Gram-positive bacteria)]MBM7052049.1 phosphoenolpyruvate--protein phosphotransferase [Rothia sp. ZJ1223]QRZ61896.1 phosphoenolpyruvate--protein phosphotransferase [Rothia sp. ZJ932]